MLVTNTGATVNIPGLSLHSGANEVEPKVWNKAKEHRLVQAFLKKGPNGHARLVEGAAPLQPGVGKNRARKTKLAVDLKIEAKEVAPEEPADDSPKDDEQPADDSDEDSDQEEPDQENPTEYQVSDAKKIVADCSDVETLKGWKKAESRASVKSAIDARIKALEK